MLALMSHGQLVRVDKLSLLRVGIVARHGSLRSILTFLGVGIVLKRFARADKLPRALPAQNAAWAIRPSKNGSPMMFRVAVSSA